MKKSELRQLIREEIENLTQNTFIYKKDSGDGKPTMILKLKPDAWEKVKHLFDKNGKPISDDVKNIKSSYGVWNLHAQSTINGSGEVIHKIYGVSGDYTFGNAPTYYNQKLRGNIRAAKPIFDQFIEKYLK